MECTAAQHRGDGFQSQGFVNGILFIYYGSGIKLFLRHPEFGFHLVIQSLQLGVGWGACVGSVGGGVGGECGWGVWVGCGWVVGWVRG